MLWGEITKTFSIAAPIAPPVVKGTPFQEFGNSGRNDTLTSVAGFLRRKGLGQESIRGALRSINDSGFSAPLDDPEVDGIAKGIIRYEPVSGTSPAFVATQFCLLPIGDLLKKPKPHDWCIRGFIEKDSLNLLFGDPNVGKSLIAIEWGVCVSLGLPWYGHATMQGPVIYLAGEGHNGLTRRLKALELTLKQNLIDTPLAVSSAAISLLDDAAIQAIINAVESEVEKNGKPSLIIIDTLARHFAGGDENSATDMTKFVAALDALRVKYGCAILVVHHSGHSNKDRARAHSVLPCAADTIYALTKRQDGLRVLRCDKAKDFEPPPNCAFKVEGVALPWLDEDETSYLTAPVLRIAEGQTSFNAKPLTPTAQNALFILTKTILTEGIDPIDACTKANGVMACAVVQKVVPLNRWRDAFKAAREGDSPDTARKAFKRAKEELEAAGKVLSNGQWVGLAIGGGEHA